MSERVQLRPASSGSFSSSLTTRYVERGRRERVREKRQAIALLLALQALLWTWAWFSTDDPLRRVQMMMIQSLPAAALFVALSRRSPRAATIIAALGAWILCVIILGFAI